MRSVILLLLACAPALVHGHGYLLEPKPRNLVHKTYQYNYPGGDGAGAPVNDAVSSRIIAGGYDFPDLYPSEKTHGLCGDPWRSEGIDYMPEIADMPMMVPTPFQAVYYEGDVIEVHMAVTANHRGFGQISICDHVLDQTLVNQSTGQRCLDEHILLRLDPYDAERNDQCLSNGNPVSPLEDVDCAPLDPTYPGRAYFPPNSLLDSVSGYAGQFWKVKYRLPQGLTCEKCTMQWWWLTGNACSPKGERDWYDLLHSTHPETDGAWDKGSGWHECSVERQGQQFWNCADIVILPQGEEPPEPEAPNPDADGDQEAENDNCAGRYQPCGTLASGYSCCQTAGDVCYGLNDYYYQCRPFGDCDASQGSCDVLWPEALVGGWPDATTPTDIEQTPPPQEPETTPPPPPPSTAAPPPPSTAAPPPPPPPPPSSTPAPPDIADDVQIDGCLSAGTIGLYGNCTGQHTGCCAAGLLCYTMNDDYAQCRAPDTCPDCTWDCAVLAQPCTAVIGKYGNCRGSHCCAEGLVCYEQDEGYAQCLEPGQCPTCDSWTCTELLHGRDDAPARRALLHPSPSAAAEEAVPVAARSEETQSNSEETVAAAVGSEASQDGVSALLAVSTLVLAAALVAVGRARQELGHALAGEHEPEMNLKLSLTQAAGEPSTA